MALPKLINRSICTMTSNKTFSIFGGTMSISFPHKEQTSKENGALHLKRKEHSSLKTQTNSSLYPPNLLHQIKPTRFKLKKFSPAQMQKRVGNLHNQNCGRKQLQRRHSKYWASLLERWTENQVPLLS